MTNEQYVMLIKNNINKADNMLQLWQQNRNYIYKLAMKYVGFAEIDDLMQEGYIGLCHAVEHYDPEKSVQFITYATLWVKQVMRRYISNCTSAIHVPEHVRNEVLQYKKIVSEYSKYYGREPSEQEIQESLGVNIKKFETIKKNVLLSYIHSLSEPIAGDDEMLLIDTLVSEQKVEEDIIEKFDATSMRAELWKAVNDLPDDMSDVIKYRYRDGLTLRQSGEKMGATIETARQKEKKALRNLRQKNVSQNYKPYYDQYLSIPIYYVSLKEFNRTWTSGVERAVLDCLNEKT